MTVSADLEFDAWCDASDDHVEGYSRALLNARPKDRADAVRIVAKALPTFYVAPKRLADILLKHGQEAAAEYVRIKMPEGPKPRSGDMGEVIACAYVEARTDYRLAIFKFRWSDSREMAMRGDDFLGVRIGKSRPEFLKGEAKSRKALKTADVEEARGGLDEHDGLPAPHALSFVADRLYDLGEEELADQIDAAGLRKKIRTADVTHMLFTLSGNAPDAFLEATLMQYAGENSQTAVGVRIKDHADFIKDVFEAADFG